MTTIFWILLIISIAIYCEGLVIASFAGAMSQPPKWVWPFLLLFWPIALPLMAYRTYSKYQPMIQQIMQNPLLGSLMGFNTPQLNPLANLLNQTASEPNPFLADLYTEAEPSGELAELIKLAQEAETTETETTETESSDSDNSIGD